MSLWHAWLSNPLQIGALVVTRQSLSDFTAKEVIFGGLKRRGNADEGREPKIV